MTMYEDTQQHRGSMPMLAGRLATARKAAGSRASLPQCRPGSVHLMALKAGAEPDPGRRTQVRTGVVGVRCAPHTAIVCTGGRLS